MFSGSSSIQHILIEMAQSAELPNVIRDILHSVQFVYQAFAMGREEIDWDMQKN